MTPETGRALRFWAVAEMLYGVVLIGLVLTFVPWKTPAFSVLLLTYAAAHIVAGHGLRQEYRWGWRLGIWTGLLGLFLGALTAAGLLTTYFFLSGTFGDFGLGASAGALLLLSVVLQVLVLYPSLKLRTLLRQPIRRDFGEERSWTRVIWGILLVPLFISMGFHGRYTLDPIEPLTETEQLESITYLRAAIDRTERPSLSALIDIPVGDGPLRISLWKDGERLAETWATGADLAEAIESGAENLIADPDLVALSPGGGRIEIQRVVDATPIPFNHPSLIAISVNPGLDGIRVQGDHSEPVWYPDALVAEQHFGDFPIIPGATEIQVGLNSAVILDKLTTGSEPLERFRTETWVEFEGRVLPVHRGNTPPLGSGPEAWHSAALEAGEFILRQLRDDGRFHYTYDPYTDSHPDEDSGDYNLPRHSGTIYSLALLYGFTGDRRYVEAAESAIEWLVTDLPDNCGALKSRCVPDSDGEFAEIGATALTAVGMMEYKKQTGSTAYDEIIRHLMNFITDLQMESGDFYHVYDLTTASIDRETRLMYYSEESALALVMAATVLGDARYSDPARRALDYLTGDKYDHFLGWFIYGADHWTCIAAEEAWPEFQSEQYVDFCVGYAEFMSRIQYTDEEGENADFRGHYGFSSLMVPQVPGTAGIMEAIVSTYRLASVHGRETEDIEAQIWRGLDALARDQIRPENSWMMPNPEAARGGIRRSLVEPEVRIDNNQHALTALMRGAHMTEELAK
jgi:hypothetical protein